MDAVSTDRDLDRLVDRLKSAEDAVARARDDFFRLRNSVDSAGELALWERLESAERAVREAIRDLDEIIYPANTGSGG